MQVAIDFTNGLVTSIESHMGTAYYGNETTYRAVFGAKAGLSDGDIALMMSSTIFAGALMQFPAGRLSDRIDRRYVLAGMAAIAAFDGLLLFVLRPSSPFFLISMVVIYGAVANTLYPIAVAHANEWNSRRGLSAI